MIMAGRFLFAASLLIISFALNPVFAGNNTGTNENGIRNGSSALTYRLPKEIVPVSYDLSIYTRPSNADYDGHVRIVLQALKKTDLIALHTDALIVQKNASLSDNSGRIIPISLYMYDEETQLLTIKLKHTLEPERYTLRVSFKGYIANDVFGFYASLYEVDGELRRIGVTQFSPAYARRAFPCMDEPHLKAEFQVRIGHHKNEIATSNTPVESIRNENDTYRVTTFHCTPRISTYLVGWAVHKFVPEQSRISENFKMWTRDAMKFRGSMALNRGRAVYAALQGWLLIKSPLEKVDHFALPDFNFNAMENWALITCRESVMLHENGSTPTRKTVNGLATMAHEYSHSWFGNLVTPAFWDVVWLKEGFATYFQYFGLSLAEPDLRMMNIFAIDCLQPALLADSDNHTRTMNGREVGSRSSIMATLDFVSYKKGASVIRMVRYMIGDTAFQLGLQNYLLVKSYQAAIPYDLYQHLQTASDKSRQLHKRIRIEDVMESWANQSGYPLVIITRNYTTKALVASQERFYLNRQKQQKPTNLSGWWIPLTFITEDSIESDRIVTAAWLEPQVKNIAIRSFEPSSWVIFNVQQIGYYRVNYDERNWQLLINYLKTESLGKIHVVNRAALLDDAFNLARAGYIDYSVPFNVATYLVRETEYEPWVAAVNNFNYLNRVLAVSPQVQGLFQNYVNHLLEPIYNRLSFSDNSADNSTTRLHRELILSAACSINNVHCKNTSKILFDSWISASKNRIPADLRSFVYCAGIRADDDNDWRIVWDRFLHTDLHTEQELLLDALGCTTTPYLINMYLNASITYELEVRKQHRIIIINAVLNDDPGNVNYVIDFICDNLRTILKSRGIDFLNKILTAIGNKVTTEAQLNKFRSFVDENVKELGSALNTAKKALTVSTTSIAWIKKYLSAIEKSLTFNRM